MGGSGIALRVKKSEKCLLILLSLKVILFKIIGILGDPVFIPSAKVIVVLSHGFKFRFFNAVSGLQNFFVEAFRERIIRRL